MSEAQTTDPITDIGYELDRAQAEDDGTALVEVIGDEPPADLYHAARDLAALIGPKELEGLRDSIGLADVDPVRWGQLDVERAASFAHSSDPDGFRRLTQQYPWLEAEANEAHHDALGALADRFVDHA